MAYQADLITLASKKTENIAAGVQGFAQGISAGMTSYAAQVAKNREEKRKRDQENLKLQNQIDNEYRTLINNASDKLYDKGGDVVSFRKNAKELGERAKQAQFELNTNTNLSRQDKDLYNYQIGEFDSYLGSSKHYAATEAAIIDNDKTQWGESSMGVDYTITSTLINNGETAEDRQKSKTYATILQKIREGKQAAVQGYTIEKTNENRSGRSVSLVTITNNETSESHTFQQTGDNLQSYFVGIPQVNVAKSFEEMGVRPKNGIGFTDDYKIGQTMTEQEISVSGYKGVLSQGVIDTYKIDTGLKAQVKANVTEIVELGGNDLVEYVDGEHLGYSDDEVTEILNSNLTNSELVTKLSEREFEIQQEKYKSQLKGRKATPQEVKMFETYGVQMEQNKDGDFMIYTETGDLKAVSDRPSEAEIKASIKNRDYQAVTEALEQSIKENASILDGDDTEAKVRFWNNWLQEKGSKVRYVFQDGEVMFVDNARAKDARVLDSNVDIDNKSVIAGNVLAEKGVPDPFLVKYRPTLPGVK